MKSKLLIICASTSIIALTGAAIAMNPNFVSHLVKGLDNTYHMTINSESSSYVLEDNEAIKQVNINGTKFDVVGFASSSGNFCSIKKANYGEGFDYNGMIYNRTAINGLAKLTVSFSGGELRYVFSDFLMENMDFNGESLTSGTSINANNKPYFIVYTTSTTPVIIESLDVEYTCDDSVESTMLYHQTSSLGGARSWTNKYTQEYNYVEIENNPTANTNNYSRGNHVSDAHDDSWYRWNGRRFEKSTDLGTDFTLCMTVVGEYTRMVDETKWFHYCAWPQFGFNGNSEKTYIQTYIGNDNYEPLGKDNAVYPDDPHVQESYTGRFFTNYVYRNGNWIFPDPDATNIAEGAETFRSAYEAYKLPFWFIKFHVYLVENNPICDTYINGFKISSEEIFNYYDKVNTPSLYLQTVELHVVNYGLGTNDQGLPVNTPREAYKGTFTYPRLVNA